MQDQFISIGKNSRLAVMAALSLFAATLGGCASETVSDEAAEPAAHGDYGASARGFAYAREACASCHAVEAGELQSPNAAAPSFQALANRSDMTRPALSALLRSPHRMMPSLIVEPDRVDDLAAYLSMLKEE